LRGSEARVRGSGRARRAPRAHASSASRKASGRRRAHSPERSIPGLLDRAPRCAGTRAHRLRARSLDRAEAPLGARSFQHHVGGEISMRSRTSTLAFPLLPLLTAFFFTALALLLLVPSARAATFNLIN